MEKGEAKDLVQITMKEFISKHWSFISYTIFGTLASLINLIVFHVMSENMHIYYLIANVVAYIIAMAFTFITNKIYVFNSKFKSWRNLVHEFLAFVNVRFFSFLLDTGIMIAGVHMFAGHPDLAKIFDQIFVGILNYYFSKWFIFRTTDRFSWNKLKWIKREEEIEKEEEQEEENNDK